METAYIILLSTTPRNIFETSFALQTGGALVRRLELRYGQAELQPDEESTQTEDGAKSPQQQREANAVGGSEHHGRCDIDARAFGGKSAGVDSTPRSQTYRWCDSVSSTSR